MVRIAVLGSMLLAFACGGGGGSREPVATAPVWVTGYRNNVGSFVARTRVGDPHWSVVLQTATWPLGVFFLNERRGWAVGQDTILATTDGGATWHEQTVAREIGAGGFALRAVAFADASLGVAVGEADDEGFRPLGYPFILRTDDGGTTWLPVVPPVPGRVTLRGACFTSRDDVVAIGDGVSGPAVLASNDAGVSWRNLVLEGAPHPAGPRGLSCATGAVWVSGGGARPLVRSTDGGRTWGDASAALPAGASLVTVRFVDEMTGWIAGSERSAGAEPLLMRTTDGGLTWNAQTTPREATTVNHVEFVDRSAGIAFWSGDGALRGAIETDDGGLTWRPRSAPWDSTGVASGP